MARTKAHATPRNAAGLALESRIRSAVAAIGQGALADELDVSPSTVTRWLSGETGIPLTVVGALLSALGIAVAPASGEPVEVVEAAELAFLRRCAIRYLEAQARG